MTPTKEQIEMYEGRCANCKFFSGIGNRGDWMWLDDEGMCYRYPPVFVGGIEDEEEDDCDTRRYRQPGVLGGNRCGEYIREAGA